MIARKVLLAAAAGALLVPERPRAAGMEVSPILVELGPRTPSSTLTVRNGGTGPARYQVSAMAWSQPPGGEQKLVPADDLAAYPPLFSLAPGEERRIRVGATAPPGTDERAWRLFVEELPAPSEAARSGPQLNLRARFALPVFQAPVLSRPAPAVTLALAGARLQVVLRSAGNVHARPTSVKVKLSADDGEALEEVDVPPLVALAMSERRADVPISAERCARVRKAVVVAEVGGERLQAALAVPSGACGP